MEKGKKFSSPTIVSLIEIIRKEGKRANFSRSSFYRLAVKYKWPLASAAGKGGWKRFTVESFDKLKKLVYEHFGI